MKVDAKAGLRSRAFFADFSTLPIALQYTVRPLQTLCFFQPQNAKRAFRPKDVAILKKPRFQLAMTARLNHNPTPSERRNKLNYPVVYTISDAPVKFLLQL